MFFVLLSFRQYAGIEDSLVAKITFNNKGAGVDETGHNLIKLMGVTPVNDRFDNPMSACFIHGTQGSYVNLGTNPRIKPREGSISIWINVDSYKYSGRGYSVNPIVLTKNDSVDDFFEGYAIAIELGSNKVACAISQSESRQVAMHSSEPVLVNRWYHFVLTYNDEVARFYYNGKKVVEVPKNFKTKFLSTDSVMIGHTANKKNERFFCGTVDDIFIYNRMLSDQEVKDLYEAPDPNRYKAYWTIFYWSLITIVLIVIIVAVIVSIYKRDLEKQKEKHRINVRLNELETKAIRTQMNPHFVFNSLNTLQRFVLEGDTRKFNSYLTKFSKLLRQLIETSVSESISLQEEVEILVNYIEIEKLRFDNSFEYSVDCQVPDPKEVFVPFMLIQPFVENAIWHGLLPKNGKRFLKVVFKPVNEKSIFCEIEDNGVGRHAKSETNNPLKKKSLAIDFIRQRLSLHEKTTGISCGFTIVDLVNDQGESTGTRVEIIIPNLRT